MEDRGMADEETKEEMMDGRGGEVEEETSIGGGMGDGGW